MTAYYQLVESGCGEPGVYKDNKILIKGVHFDIESCYQSEGVILLNKNGNEFPLHKTIEDWVKHWEDTTIEVIPRHPLSSKRADTLNLREYFFGKYPLEQFSDYLKMSMYPTPNVTFEYQDIKELSTESTEYIYKYDNGKEIAISLDEAFERAIAFKEYVDHIMLETLYQ
ncbi:MAG: hypothetical protein ACKPBH_22320 [Dolichospermum sp.]